jgi:predicted nucleotidyltransferase
VAAGDDPHRSVFADAYLSLVPQIRTVSDIVKQATRVCIDAGPAVDQPVFRVGAADEVLDLLVDAHETEFTIPELVDATGASRSTVWRAVDLLDALGVVRVRETPQRNYVSVDPERLEKPDPLLAIPQAEFRAPVRAFVDRVRETIDDPAEVDDLLGVVVFGSVVRGEADRRSDVDLFVLVDGDRTAARRAVTDVVASLSEERFDGDRFAFEPYVETPASARRAGEKLREIFDEGLTVAGSDELQRVRKAVLAGE